MKEIDRAKKEEFERKTLIESLEKMPARVVATAYLYAMNYELYGEDVTKKWQTAVQNTASLQRAYLDGRRDEAQRQAGYPVIQPVPREALNRLLITHEQAVDYLQSTGRRDMTRFEQIKTEWTIEELAKLLCKLSVCSSCIASGYCYNHHTGYVDWLKEEVEGATRI